MLRTALFASHTPETSVFRVGSHHLARQFARRGLVVGHLSTPLSLAKLVGLGDRTGLRDRWSAWLQGPMPSPDGLHTSAVPLTLLPVQVAASRGTTGGLRTAVPPLPRTLRGMGLLPLDLMLVDQALFAGLPNVVPARTVVYRATDVYDDPRLRAAEAVLVERAHAVVATSQAVLDGLPSRAAELPHLVLENGVDFPVFRDAGAAAVDREPEGLVYVGALDGRLDWTWLADLVQARSGLRVDLYGPVVEPPVDLPPGVRLCGQVPHDELPALLARYAVGLLPFGPGASNLGRSPMKLHEYLAAGLHVLATPYFAQGSRPPAGVHVHRDPLDAAATAHALLRTPPQRAGVEVASTVSWEHRADELLGFLEGVHERRVA